jgi:hypothetical protein
MKVAGGNVKAAPIAAPRKGAEQGVATMVARMPEKKVPRAPCLRASLPPMPVALVPISKSPNMFRARRNITRRSPHTTHGFWSW